MGAILPRTAQRPHKEDTGARQATNVTLSEALLVQARALGINISQACEQGLAREVAETGTQRWLGENRAAMDAWNEHVALHGLPRAAFRQFGWRG